MSLLAKTRPSVALASGVALGVTLAIGAPAVGTQVQRAFDAQNAHQVDGKHAVGSGASVTQRKGKLVAAGSDGRLPNNIIKKAPNAGKLDGVKADDYRFLPLDLGSVYALGGAVFSGGVRLPDTGTPSASWQWTLPQDYRPGRPVTLVLQIVTTVAGGSVTFARSSSTFARPGLPWNGNAADPVFRTPNPLPTPVVQRVEVVKVEVVPPPGVGQFQPGDSLGSGVSRTTTDSNADAVFIRSAVVSY